ncbi:putative glycosidase [Diplonema papillatum]|nr:putative glycosidase [Diplonema papillatum]
MLLPVALALVLGVQNPEEYVNTEWGAKGIFDWSRGNLLPEVVTPWGFAGWAPETDTSANVGGWWWKPENRQFHGMRCTHRPSPWIGDWDYFSILPLLKNFDGIDTATTYTAYNPDKSVWKPYLFETHLEAYGNRNGKPKLSFTSTAVSGHMQVAYPAYDGSTGFDQVRRVMIKLGNNFAMKASNDKNGNTIITGQSQTQAPPMYLHIVINDTAIANSSTPGENGGSAFYVDFNYTSNVFDVVAGVSLLSQEQAEFSIPVGKTFQQVMLDSKAEWNKRLSAVQVNDLGNQDPSSLNVLYSCLYRALQFPRFISETNSSGSEVHTSTYASGGGVFPGPAVTDSGFWDAYRTVYPLQAILSTPTLGRMIEGWVNAYKEGGWLPKWAAPGYLTSMVATMGDVTLADAIVLDIPGFDREAAYAAIRQDAFNPASLPGTGRSSLADYLRLGYVPNGDQEDVSVSLNYMLSDWAIANAARKLGKTDDANILEARAKNYTKLFYKGFFRSKSSAGDFIEPFDEFLWGGSYTEAGPWQYRFYVPYDPKGLAKLYQDDGLDMCEMLQKAQTTVSTYHLGPYNQNIHEMTEMANNCWGQYEHNNQPVHHMLYMFGAISDTVGSNCSQRGQYWLRKAVTELYQPGINLFVGDEDNGELSAWYILSALGIYPLAPSSGVYQLGTPLWRDVSVQLPNKKTLRITSNEPNSTRSQDMVVTSATFNGAAIAGTTIAYTDLMSGGTLHFNMIEKKQ